MPVCEHCGNDYHRTLVVEMAGEQHVFDSFECAIAALAPRCRHCGCQVIGHGVEEGDHIYCCAHCLRHGAETVGASGHRAGQG
jgi:hypothetical protein